MSFSIAKQEMRKSQDNPQIKKKNSLKTGKL